MTLRAALLLSLLALPGICRSQGYPYFPPPGMGYSATNGNLTLQNLTLESVTGVVLCDGSSALCAAATASNIIPLWTGTPSSTQALGSLGALISVGSVTGVTITVPAPLTATTCVITTSGTCAITWTAGEPQNEFLATANGSSGPVGLRAIVAPDLPNLGGTPTATVGPTATAGTASTYVRTDGAPAICLTCTYTWTGPHTFSDGITVGDGATFLAPPSGHTVSITAASATDTAEIITGASAGQALTEYGANANASPGFVGTAGTTAQIVADAAVGDTVVRSATAVRLTANAGASTNLEVTNSAATFNGTAILTAASSIPCSQLTNTPCLNASNPFTTNQVISAVGAPRWAITGSSAEADFCLNTALTGSACISGDTLGDASVRANSGGSAWLGDTSGVAFLKCNSVLCNVTGTIQQGGVDVCLSNGGNCPAGTLGTATFNLTSAGTGTPTISHCRGCSSPSISRVATGEWEMNTGVTLATTMVAVCNVSAATGVSVQALFVYAAAADPTADIVMINFFSSTNTLADPVSGVQVSCIVGS